MPTAPQNPNNEFINQLEQLYRGGDKTSNLSQPTPQSDPLFRGTAAEQAVSGSENRAGYEQLIQDEDLSRQAATERNNAIQDNAARQAQAQLDADLLRKQEQAALERIRQNRLSRPPNELLERQFPDRPGLTNVERFRDQRPTGQPESGYTPRSRATGGSGYYPGSSGASGGRTGGSGGGRPGSGGGRPGASSSPLGEGGGSPIAEPPAGVPTGSPPRLPGLPSINLKLPFQIPPGVATPLSRIAPAVGRGLGIAGGISLALELPGAIQRIGDSASKLNNAIHRAIDPVPQLSPGLGNALDRIQPVRPSPFQTESGVSYRVTATATSSRIDMLGHDSGQPGGTVTESFVLAGPILGTIVESARGADGTIYSKGLVILSGNPDAPTRTGVAGGSTFVGGGIVSIVRLAGNTYMPVGPPVFQSPSPTTPAPHYNPNSKPVPIAYPSAPQQRQQPIAPAPTMNPSAPPGTPSATPSSPNASPNPIAPAFPAQPPGFPSIPNMGGIPLLPLAIPQRTAAPNAAPGASPSPAGSASGGGAPDANPYYQPKWADPTADPAPGESGTPATPTPTEPTTLLCRFQFDQQLRSGVTTANTGIGQANTKLVAVEAAETALQTYVTAEVTNINTKLGPLIPGGITGQLLLQWGRMVKMWNFLQIDRMLNVLTWIGVLHNAYQLSSGLTQTLFSAIANSLDAIGIQKVDEHGNESPYDIREIVSHWTDSFFKRVFGVDTVDNIKEQWKKYNRIYQAATNLLNSIQSMMYTVLDAMQNIGEYVSKIGNAAKAFGTFAENCYDWMSPKFNFMNSKLFKGLDDVNTFLQNIDQISSNVVDGQQQFQELNTQKTELDKSIADAVGEKQKAEDRKKQESAGATVTTTAERKPES